MLLTDEFNSACENVCKHLFVLDNDYKHCHEFEIDDAMISVTTCKYVHEFQHLLKLFGIEKDIKI